MAKKKKRIVDYDSPDLMYNFYVRQKNWQNMGTVHMNKILDRIYPHVNHLQKAEINGVRRKLAIRDDPQFGDLEIIG